MGVSGRCAFSGWRGRGPTVSSTTAKGISGFLTAYLRSGREPGKTWIQQDLDSTRPGFNKTSIQQDPDSAGSPQIRASVGDFRPWLSVNRIDPEQGKAFPGIERGQPGRIRILIAGLGEQHVDVVVVGGPFVPVTAVAV